MVICPDCGKDVEKSKFCKNCGAYIANIEEPKPIIAESQDLQLTADVAVNSKESGVKFCFNCGNEIPEEFEFCPNCGQDLNSSVVKSSAVTQPCEKNILLAIILSVFLPGLGQIYLGLDNKGAIFLIAYVVSVVLILVLIGFLLCFIIWIWALIDTIISTNAVNRGDEVKDKLF